MRSSLMILAAGAVVGIASQVQAVPGVTWDFYAGVGGSGVSDLTSSPAYIAHTPTSTSTLTSFETPSNITDNYGSAVYGYFTPALTGNYFFATASDDNSAVYLSTDSNPANSVQIAAETQWGSSRNYDSPEGGGAVHSGAVPLVAGQHYYILGLMKENGGGDNFAVTASFGADTIVNGQDPLGTGTALPLGTLSTTVPEPASIAMLGLATGGLLLRRRKA